MSKEVKIAYEPHPVSPERKAELRKAGFKIVDARFDPDRAAADAGDAATPVGDDEQAKAELAAARADYEVKLGKKPFMGWDAATLRAKIAGA
ncbi:hypothetical protein [Mesorhizobium amorphae]|uniref:hypothetical protein n=1 Tax=Mesorhizobium amorphae TaxID=71433 RepID=UPI001182FAD5|nr:hypothetical protein [Mesorhizobium amorphae]